MKKKTLNWIKLIIKYSIPVIVGWLEGDTHAIASAIAGLLTIF